MIAQGYAAWGWPGFLQRLDGMFALAIIDVRANQLLLARDRFMAKSHFILPIATMDGSADQLCCQ